nr:MAG TPA: hypothetical protein [Caudoviricetes sp.]
MKSGTHFLLCVPLLRTSIYIYLHIYVYRLFVKRCFIDINRLIETNRSKNG